MTSQELHYLSISEAADLISQKRLSPVELTHAHLTRIEATEPRLNSFITLLAYDALASAQTAEQEIQAGDYRGPLHGIPIGVARCPEPPARGIDTLSDLAWAEAELARRRGESGRGGSDG